jgi:hypothetical protein
MYEHYSEVSRSAERKKAHMLTQAHESHHRAVRDESFKKQKRCDLIKLMD